MKIERISGYVIKFVFTVLLSRRLPRYIKDVDHLLLAYIKLFLNNNKRSGTSLPTSFSAWFCKKNISHTIFY